VRLVDHPTVRESDGLALSSRNRYLNPDQRRRATALWRSLARGEDLLRQGERASQIIADAMRDELAETDGIDYAELRQVPDLSVPSRAEGTVMLAVAAQVGPARLIDNSVLRVTRRGVEPASLLGEWKTT
jgi:pantoate--beta-alanine ligase